MEHVSDTALPLDKATIDNLVTTKIPYLSFHTFRPVLHWPRTDPDQPTRKELRQLHKETSRGLISAFHIKVSNPGLLRKWLWKHPQCYENIHKLTVFVDVPRGEKGAVEGMEMKRNRVRKKESKLVGERSVEDMKRRWIPLFEDLRRFANKIITLNVIWDALDYCGTGELFEENPLSLDREFIVALGGVKFLRNVKMKGYFSKKYHGLLGELFEGEEMEWIDGKEDDECDG